MIPGQGSKIPQATWHSQTINKYLNVKDIPIKCVT